MVRPTITIGFSLAGVACGLTMVYLSMRAVMDVGGFCAEGGPFEIETHCPQGVPGVMVGSLWGGIILAGVYAWQVFGIACPASSGCCGRRSSLSLGWNFLEFAFDPPGTQGGVVWGWLICGIMFMLMGGLPLIVMLPATVRALRASGNGRRVGRWGCRSPTCSAWLPGSSRRQRAAAGGHGGRAERLAKLHERGALTDDEYTAAKRMLL